MLFLNIVSRSKEFNIEVNLFYLELTLNVTNKTGSEMLESQSASYILILNVSNPNEKMIELKQAEIWLTNYNTSLGNNIENSMIHLKASLEEKKKQLRPEIEEYLVFEGDCKVTNELLRLMEKPVENTVYITMVVEGRTIDGERAATGRVVRRVPLFAVGNKIIYTPYDIYGIYG